MSAGHDVNEVYVTAPHHWAYGALVTAASLLYLLQSFYSLSAFSSDLLFLLVQKIQHRLDLLPSGSF